MEACHDGDAPCRRFSIPMRSRRARGRSSRRLTGPGRARGGCAAVRLTPIARPRSASRSASGRSWSTALPAAPTKRLFRPWRGFALVTHGVWVQPQIVRPAVAAIATPQLPAKRSRSRSRSVEPSFRRAAYSDHRSSRTTSPVVDYDYSDSRSGRDHPIYSCRSRGNAGALSSRRS